jgi:hypothetical protein
MNEKQSEFITHMFELKNLDRVCNHRGCQKPPAKEILLYETDIILKERKEMASLYLCREHYNNTTKDITASLNEIAHKRYIVGKKEFDMGVITH